MVVVTFKESAERVRPPRAVYVRFPIGLTLGGPGEAAKQRVVIEDALGFLADAEQPGSLRVLPYRWHGFDYERILTERRGG